MNSDEPTAELPVATVIAQSNVPGGAEAYLCRLYGEPGSKFVRSSLIGSLPNWTGSQIDLQLGPKWSKRTMLRGVLKMRRERARVIRAAQQSVSDYYHMQFKREQIAFTKAVSLLAPVVWTEHGRLPTGRAAAPIRWAYSRAARSASLIICVSNEVASDVRRLVGPGVPVEVIENCVNTEYFREPTPEEKATARAALDLGDTPTVLWIGRTDAGKRPMLAIRAGWEWRGATLVAGRGSEDESLRDAAAGSDRIRLMGHVTDTRTLYWASDIFMFTSTGAGEGYPTTTMAEAAACGLPAVTHVGSGAERVISEMGGHVVPDGDDVNGWIRAFEGALSNSPEARRTWVESHSLTSWIAQHRGALERVMKAVG
ncbi:glycosyltransferase family 4 protein [Nocardioides ochotonae]|uniref:glycosyltransferase family 4 protein n=1 Tax=Nocardioides ochotonae TaxID=2685869 RepID=UPI0014076B62